ncbi:MAG: DUF1538 domain-containing protein [Desulfotalea sp.]
MPGKNHRMGDYQRFLTTGQNEISLNKFVKEVKRDENGEIIPLPFPQVKLNRAETVKLLRPYISVRFMEQVKAVVPLAVYLALFQLFILRQLVEDSWVIMGGLFAAIVGLMFFMEGLTLGLMPFGTIIGKQLPRKSSLPMVMLVTVLLGIGVTFAEPAISALKAAGGNVVVEKAPYLYAMLNGWSEILVLVVGASVGLAAALGTLRFLYGWSLKPLIYASLVPVLALTVIAAFDPELQKILGLAWDCGAVTTGPVTVPLVLSLGIGIAASAGKGDSGLSGFGVVTLASIFPILGVLLLSFFISCTVTPAEIIESAMLAAQTVQVNNISWYQKSPGQEILLGVQAILPLVLFLFAILTFLLKEKLEKQGEILYGIGITILGMCIFNLGLTYGLSKLGDNAGTLVPTAFMEVIGQQSSPLYVYGVGLTLALVFAWFLGYGATLAEPALSALGTTTENLTNGVFKKKTLVMSVSIGVGFGIALGVAKLIFDIPLVWLILPGYLIAIVLTYFSTEEFVNIAWDSAGVTTGPITVPLVLAMGLGLGNATHAIEGFGILCMASIGPIISVMISGLWARYKAYVEIKLAKNERMETGEQEAKAII